MANYLVTNANDSGTGSLREAIALSNVDPATRDVITFASGLASNTITLTLGALQINGDVAIDGDVNGDNIADITLSGNNTSRIINSTAGGVILELNSLNIVDGNSGNGNGGAIYVDGATVLVEDTTFRSSTGANGGAIYGNNSNLSVVNSLFVDNDAAVNSALSQGGAICSTSGSITLSNTTVTNNRSGGFGGGLAFLGSTVNIQNTTITNNSAEVAGTSAVGGGGVYRNGTTGNLTILNSIVANNYSGPSLVKHDVAGTILTSNFSAYGSIPTIIVSNGNLYPVANLGLGELLDNGGTVLTYAPLDGSILINTGNNGSLPSDFFDLDEDGNIAEQVPEDARGAPRIVGGTVDIGTVEWIANETIRGNAAINNIFGGIGNDKLYGLGSGDTLDGGSGLDQMYGGTGNDRLLGGSENDSMYGELNDDYLDGGAGMDYMDGGDGFDTVSYLSSLGDVRVDMLFRSGNTGDAVGDSFVSIESLQGSSFNDILYATEADDLVLGGDGQDLMWTRGGNDRLVGGNGNDSMYGREGNDILDGGAGMDYMDGGADDDYVTYQNSLTGITVDMTYRSGNTGDSVGDSFVSIERLRGTEFADRLTAAVGSSGTLGTLIEGLGGADYIEGREGFNWLLGGEGADQLYGGADGDLLEGGAGADYLDGGSGQDTASYGSAYPGVTVDMVNQNTNTGDAAGDFLYQIEDLTGSSGDDRLLGTGGNNYLSGLGGNDLLFARAGTDTLFGNEGDDILEGGLGADALWGEGGIDTASYASAVAAVQVDLVTPGLNTGEAQGDTFYQVENITGSSFTDNLFGSIDDNVLTGRGGVDQMFGRWGNDTLNGGLGADYLDGGDDIDTASYVDAVALVQVDLINQNTNTGEATGDQLISIENLTGSNFSDRLLGTAGNNRLVGGNGDDMLWARAGDDTLIGGLGGDTIYGLEGSDTLEGGIGNDIMDGGADADFFLYNLEAGPFFFTVLFGQDTINQFQDGIDKFNFTATGLTFDSFVITQSGANTLMTWSVDNTITLTNFTASNITGADFV